MNINSCPKPPVNSGHRSGLKKRSLLSAGIVCFVLAASAWATTDSTTFTIADWTEQYDVAHAAAVKSQQASEAYFAKNDIKAHCVADREFLFYFQRKLMISQKISELVSKDSIYDDKSRKALADQVDSIKHGVKLTQRGVDLVCGTYEEQARAHQDMLTDLNVDIKAAQVSGDGHLSAGKEAAGANDTPAACREIRAALVDFATTRDRTILLLKLIGDGGQLTPEEKTSEREYIQTLTDEINELQKGFVDTECKSH